MKNLQLWFEKTSKDFGVFLLKFLFVAGIFTAFLFFLGFLGGSVKAEQQTFQESVEMAQADYNLSQKQAKDAMLSYCESWKALAISKAELAKEMQISSNLNLDAVRAVDCQKTYVPSSF